MLPRKALRRRYKYRIKQGNKKQGEKKEDVQCLGANKWDRIASRLCVPWREEDQKKPFEHSPTERRDRRKSGEKLTKDTAGFDTRAQKKIYESQKKRIQAHSLSNVWPVRRQGEEEGDERSLFFFLKFVSYVK